MNDQSSLADWAVAVRMAMEMLGQVEQNPFCLTHPAVILQGVMGLSMTPSGPVEFFSDDRPISSSKQQSDDLIPIDEVLGRYISKERKIEIFKKNIEHYEKTVFLCYNKELEYLVRIHEYAHALVHLGTSFEVDRSLLLEYPQGEKTNWTEFEDKRDQLFSAVDTQSHEFLAQILTWSTIKALTANPRTEALRDVFLALMEKQPEDYRVSIDILEMVTNEKIRFMLEWLWEPVGLEPDKSVPLRESLTALLKSFDGNVTVGIHQR